MGGAGTVQRMTCNAPSTALMGNSRHPAGEGVRLSTTGSSRPRKPLPWSCVEHCREIAPGFG
jgi:hypothetical protein